MDKQPPSFAFAGCTVGLTIVAIIFLLAFTVPADIQIQVTDTFTAGQFEVVLAGGFIVGLGMLLISFSVAGQMMGR